MALTDKEREQIIEEERVRWETRRLLLQEAYAGNACGHGHYGRRHRFGFHVLKALLLIGGVAWLLSHYVCHL